MKKLLLLIAAMLMTATGTMAQNANRKGFFLELQGGSAIGEVLNYSLQDDSHKMPKLKGGMTGSIDFGYRVAPSSHFAFEMKLGIWANLADVKNTRLMRFLPGVRWTSKDFGTHNMSTFVAFNTGVGFHNFNEDPTLAIPFELAIGMNFSQHLYGGIIFNYPLYVNNKDVDWQWTSQTTNPLHDHTYILTNVRNYPSIGLRLGYRF